MYVAVIRLNRIHMQSKSFAAIATATLLIASVAIASFLYPDNWMLPRSLAAIFGPFMAMKIGFGSFAMPGIGIAGAGVLATCSALFSTALLRPNRLTMILAVVGVALWLYSGYHTGGWLYA